MSKQLNLDANASIRPFPQAPETSVPPRDQRPPKATARVIIYHTLPLSDKLADTRIPYLFRNNQVRAGQSVAGSITYCSRHDNSAALSLTV
jgi:hypothetical protein